MQINELKKLVEEEFSKIEDYKVYYALREYKYKKISPQTIELTKVIIALDKLNIPITCDTVYYFGDTLSSKSNLYLKLHNLGDKHVLLLKRKERGLLEWVIHPCFKKLLVKYELLEDK